MLVQLHFIKIFRKEKKEMKKNARILSLLLSVAMVFGLMVVPAAAEGTPAKVTIAPVTEDLAKDDVVTLNVTIENNPGFDTYNWTFAVEGAVELTDIAYYAEVEIDGEKFTKIYMNPISNVEKNLETKTIGGYSADAPFTGTENAVVLKLVLKATDAAAADTIKVSAVNNQLLCDNEPVDVEFYYGEEKVNTEEDDTTGGSSSGDSTTGDDNTGDSTTGGSTTGDSTTGGSTTGDSTTGGSTTGDSTTGGSTTGDSTTGGSTTGDSTTGGSTTGDSTTGGSTTGDSTTGDTTTGGGDTGDGEEGDTEVPETPEEPKKEKPQMILPRLLSVTVNVEEGAKANTSEKFAIAYGARRTIKLTVEEGFEIVDVVINGKSVGASDTITLKGVVKNQNIVVKTAKVAVEDAE